MDEQPTRLVTTRKLRAVEPRKDPASEVTRLRTDIEDARDGLGVYVTELDRRRHDAFNLKRQLKKHKAIGIGVGVAAAAGAVALVLRSRRKTAQNQPWSSWRVAPAVAQKSRRVGKFLLGTAVPLALKAARGVVERTASHRPRLA
jgi:hypothetical protein